MSAFLILSLSSRVGCGGRPKRRWTAASSRVLDRLVSAADDRLERGDHVADHIFRRIMQQRHQALLGV